MESRGRRRWRRGEGRWLFGAELQSLVSQAKTHDRYSCKTKVLWKEYLGDNIIISHHYINKTQHSCDNVSMRQSWSTGPQVFPSKRIWPNRVKSKAAMNRGDDMTYDTYHIISISTRKCASWPTTGHSGFPEQKIPGQNKAGRPNAMVVTHFIGLCLASWDAIEPG